MEIVLECDSKPGTKIHKEWGNVTQRARDNCNKDA